MVGIRVLINGIVLGLLAVVGFGAPVQAAWPTLPTDAEIQEAATRFVQEKAFDRELPNCEAIADANERNLCVTRFGMNFMLGPEFSHRGEIVEASTLKMHHTAQPDPLLGNAVVLLFTQKLWVIHRDGGSYTKLVYGKAVLDYGGPDPAPPGWHFSDNRWYAYDSDDLDASLVPNAPGETTIGDPIGPDGSLSPRAWRDATVYVQFKPLDERGYYGWLPGFRQNLTVIGYNGETDPLRMPLTFWIGLEDAGKPVAGTRIPFEVGGDVKCLADRYAVWDAANRRWQEGWHNFATGPVSPGNAPVTDQQGKVIVRLFLDFSRMRLFDLHLPCTLEFAAFAPNPATPETYQKAETTLEVKSPAFMRGIFYNMVTREGAARKDNIFGLNQLRDWFQPLTPGRDPLGINRAPAFEEPTQARVLSRISLDGQEFVPPSAQNDYFTALKSGAILNVDASSQPLPVQGDGSGRTWIPRSGDGIGVVIMWLDGTTGLFVVHNRSPDLNSVLRMRFVEGWGTTQGAPSSDESWFARFVIGQGADWVVKTAAVGGATLVGGPVAGAWVGIIVEGAQKMNDLQSIGELANKNARVIWIRSEVALTTEFDGAEYDATGLDGRHTLYVFEGAPGVEDAQGVEVTAGAGEAIEFTLGGAVVARGAQEAPPLAAAMQAALPVVDAPVAAELDDAGAQSAVAPGGGVAEGTRGADSAWDSTGVELIDDLVADLSDEGWMFVFGAGAFVIVVVIGAVARGRSRRGRTVTAQCGDFAMLPDKTRTVTPATRTNSRPTRDRPPVSAASPGPATPPRAPLPAAAPAAAPSATAAGLTCVRCGQPVRATARFCAHCGEQREVVLTPPPALATPVCPSCQAPLRAGVRFCGACGHSVEP